MSTSHLMLVARSPTTSACRSRNVDNSANVCGLLARARVVPEWAERGCAMLTCLNFTPDLRGLVDSCRQGRGSSSIGKVSMTLSAGFITLGSRGCGNEQWQPSRCLRPARCWPAAPARPGSTPRTSPPQQHPRQSPQSRRPRDHQPQLGVSVPRAHHRRPTPPRR